MAARAADSDVAPSKSTRLAAAEAALNDLEADLSDGQSTLDSRSVHSREDNGGGGGARAPRPPPPKWQVWRAKVFAFLEDPKVQKTNIFAAAYAIYMFLLIVLATVSYCIATMPTVNNSAETQRAFDIIEYFVMPQFTVDYLLRVACAKRPLRFAVQPLSLVDLVSIVPFYVQLGLSGDRNVNVSALAVLRVLRLTRLLRFLRAGRYSGQLRIINIALVRSRTSFFMLLFILLLAVIFFSTCMYLAETAICTLQGEVWIYNDGTPQAGEPTPFQVCRPRWDMGRRVRGILIRIFLPSCSVHLQTVGGCVVLVGAGDGHDGWLR